MLPSFNLKCIRESKIYFYKNLNYKIIVLFIQEFMTNISGCSVKFVIYIKQFECSHCD